MGEVIRDKFKWREIELIREDGRWTREREEDSGMR